jgi:hypothetical protein
MTGLKPTLNTRMFSITTAAVLPFKILRCSQNNVIFFAQKQGQWLRVEVGKDD